MIKIKRDVITQSNDSITYVALKHKVKTTHNLINYASIIISLYF